LNDALVQKAPCRFGAAARDDVTSRWSRGFFLADTGADINVPMKGRFPAHGTIRTLAEESVDVVGISRVWCD
jgi:hypothetical protein